jgi:hypothetical protein
VLTEHGCPIAPSTFYDALNRHPSRRALRDEQLMQLIADERDSNRFVAGLGAREMWLRLRGNGHDVARCTIERLMREMGLEGVTRRRRSPRTTTPRPGRGPAAGSGRPALPCQPTEPVVGRGLHLLPDLVGDGLRRLRLRCLLPPHPRLARDHLDDHPAGEEKLPRRAKRPGGAQGGG